MKDIFLGFAVLSSLLGFYFTAKRVDAIELKINHIEQVNQNEFN